MHWHEIMHLPIFEILHSPTTTAILGATAILGPGRKLLVDGISALYHGSPNMNSLIGLGCITSFSVGLLTLLNPSFPLDASFMSEPIMLLGFILLGRALETSARLNATSDLRSIADLLPKQSRLVLDSEGSEEQNTNLDPFAETMQLQLS